MHDLRTKGPWSDDEDRLLRKFIKEYNSDYKKIEGAMNYKRDSKQIRERWVRHLDPKIDHSPITEEEGAQIMLLAVSLKRQWTRIAEHLPGRSDRMIKNYYSQKKPPKASPKDNKMDLKFVMN
ncbi:7456_t:CDS:2 [Ambispora gerdemannii]|uniref:7456_t:CDS:1 n=1 Tax=Ambispora gerdemannii TaxID=144530 RepID=A0A9N8V9U6_9GLOM|nr:7456_t:CDS:2 [Ambispora gerdemannii]